MTITRAEVGDRLSHHTMDADQIVRSNAVRACAKSLGEAIVDATPASREQSLAVTALEESLMWANKAIARGGS